MENLRVHGVGMWLLIQIVIVGNRLAKKNTKVCGWFI